MPSLLSERKLATDEIHFKSKLQSCLSSKMADKLNSDGFLIETAEQEPTEDMQTEFNNLAENDEDNLLSEVKDDIPSAQVQRQKPTTSREHETKQPKEKPSTSSHQQNDLGRKCHRKDKSTKTSTSNSAKRSRQEEELNSIQEKINSSNNSIGFLKNHLEKGTCPKTLRYTARANIMPDEDFQNEIGSIRKKAEQGLVGALVKFHHRRIEGLRIKLRKLEQAKSRKSNFVNK